MGFLTKDGLEHIKNHKYKSSGYSPLDLKFNVWWEGVLNVIPKSMAPNLITLAGFIIMMISYGVFAIYDLTLEKEVPRWTFWVSGLCMFIYQTLDAVDGKQARKTGSSSPLGQLFDHGCDSFSVSFVIVAVAQATRFGNGFGTLAFWAIAQYPFFLAHWDEYHTETMKTFIGPIGVTESQLTVMAVMFCAGAFGQEFWLLPMSHFIGNVPVIGALETRFMLVAMVVPGAFFMAANPIMSVLRIAKSKGEALKDVLMLHIIFASAYLWTTTDMWVKAPAIVMLYLSSLIALINCKLIVCSMAKMKVPFFTLEAATVPLYIVCIIMRNQGNPVLDDKSLLVICFSLVLVSTFLWTRTAILEICHHLKIKCFTIKAKEA